MTVAGGLPSASDGKESAFRNAGDPGSILGQEDALEKGIGTHSGILAQISSWTEKPDQLQSVGLQRAGHD